MHLGLPTEDAKDCAAAFVGHLLREHGCVYNQSPVNCQAQPLINRCARNFAIDFLRGLTSEHSFECPWSESISADGNPIPWDCPDLSPLPEEIQLLDEFWNLIASAAADLTPLQRELFYRRYIVGELIGDIAVSLRKTEKAADQALRRARRRIRTKLEKQGFTEAEIRGYLSSYSDWVDIDR